MTEVEAAVRQLGKAIQADPRYTAYWRAKADNDADTDLQNDIQAFNLKKMSYQHETEKLEEKRNPEKLEKLAGYPGAVSSHHGKPEYACL